MADLVGHAIAYLRRNSFQVEPCLSIEGGFNVGEPDGYYWPALTQDDLLALAEKRGWEPKDAARG